jgi:hypothetical protein
MGSDDQDWTTGRGDTRLMLNTDVSSFHSSSWPHMTFLTSTTHRLSRSSSFPQMCLVFDIKENLDRNIPCCSKIGGCEDYEASRKRCPMYAQHDRMQRASDAVHDMLGGESTQQRLFMPVLTSRLFKI